MVLGGQEKQAEQVVGSSAGLYTPTVARPEYRPEYRRGGGQIWSKRPDLLAALLGLSGLVRSNYGREKPDLSGETGRQLRH